MTGEKDTPSVPGLLPDDAGDPNAASPPSGGDPIITVLVDAPDHAEFGVVEIPGTERVGPLFEILDDLGLLHLW